MKHALATVSLLALLFLGAGCASMSSSSEADKIAAAKELDARFLAAFNKGDVDGVMATYWKSPELVSYMPDQLECRGWDAVRQNMMEMTRTMKGCELRLMDMHYRVVGDSVLGWGLWRMKLPGQGQEMVGRYTDVKEKRDGKWVFVLDHASAPLPAGD